MFEVLFTRTSYPVVAKTCTGWYRVLSSQPHMSAKSGFFILTTFFAIAVGLWLYVRHRPGTHIRVDRVANRQQFAVPYTSRLGAVDPPAPVHVRGYLDGKAVIYQDRNNTLNSSGLPVWRHTALHGLDPYLLRLRPGKIDTTIVFSTGSTDFSLIYQPLTAKNGELTIDVDY